MKNPDDQKLLGSLWDCELSNRYRDTTREHTRLSIILRRTTLNVIGVEQADTAVSTTLRSTNAEKALSLSISRWRWYCEMCTLTDNTKEQMDNLDDS